MKNVLVIAILVIGLAFASAAYADSVSGKVASVNAAANTVTVSVTDATGATTDAVISVSGSATYVGVAGLGELAAGDEVKLEATQDAATQAWTATSIEKVAAIVPEPAM